MAHSVGDRIVDAIPFIWLVLLVYFLVHLFMYYCFHGRSGCCRSRAKTSYAYYDEDEDGLDETIDAHGELEEITRSHSPQDTTSSPKSSSKSSRRKKRS
jgi:hypothetical protein